MEWGQVLTIIFGVGGFMSIFVFLINKRIDDLRQDMMNFKEDVDKRFTKLEEEIKELRSEMREMRELLYRVLGAEKKG